MLMDEIKIKKYILKKESNNILWSDTIKTPFFLVFY
jgi:hypothetical protein